MIRALLFDLDDTLMDHTAAARAGVDEWCRQRGLNTGQHQRFAAIERKWFTAYERGEVSHQSQRIARCREFLGEDMDDAAALAAYDGYLAAYQSQWRAFADARPTLEWALASGFRVGILTNGQREMQQAKLEAGGLALADVPLIPTVELGYPNPPRQAYLAACERLDVTPAETLMVGDSLENDVLGARRAGLRAVYLDRSGKGEGDVSCLSQLTRLVPPNSQLTTRAPGSMTPLLRSPR